MLLTQRTPVLSKEIKTVTKGLCKIFQNHICPQKYPQRNLMTLITKEFSANVFTTFRESKTQKTGETSDKRNRLADIYNNEQKHGD